MARSEANENDSRHEKRIVRFIYLSPTDRPLVLAYRDNLERGARQLQRWFTEKLDGFTFALNEPEVVECYQTAHPAAWYHSPPTGKSKQWFWQSTLEEAFALTGARYNDPEFRWMFYIDADPGCNQSVGAAGGVALVGANDLRGLSGEPFVPPCPGEPQYQFTWGRCVGGMAHELGHTVGINHPEDSPGGPDDRTLMYQGYEDFPDTYLRAGDVEAFRSSGFFSHRLDAENSTPV